MDKFEYKVIFAPSPSGGTKKTMEKNINDAEIILNQLGQDGWEVSGMNPNHTTLKRKIQ